MRRLLVVCALVCLATVLLLPARLSGKDSDFESRTKRIEELRDEITLINCVNGLNLTEDQLKALVAIAKEVDARREEAKAKCQKLVEDTELAFSELRVNLLAKGTHIPEDVAGKAGSLNERIKELHNKQYEEFQQYTKKVCAVLSDAQKEVISNFKPCLLPPKSQKNPVLVGQSEEKGGTVKMLRRVRELPEKKYAEKRESFLQREFDRLKKDRVKLTDAEMAAERERMFGLIEQVRAMSDEEFELAKERLATEFEVKDRAKELYEELARVTEERDPERAERGIAKYFLRPQMLPILEDRLKNLQSYQQASQVDLDKIAPTEPPTCGGE